MKYFIVTLMFSFNLFAQENCSKETFDNYILELNNSFKNVNSSPLTTEDLEKFEALDHFVYNEKLCLSAKFVRTPNEPVFEMPTTTDRMPLYVKYGEAHFEYEGKLLKLNIYQNQELVKNKLYKNHLFLPFSDLTSGNETYIGGRYLDLKIPENDSIIINFNLAYNPYCTYNYKYSCPKVPLENDLPVAIIAGIKDFK